MVLTTRHKIVLAVMLAAVAVAGVTYALVEMIGYISDFNDLNSD